MGEENESKRNNKNKKIRRFQGKKRKTGERKKDNKIYKEYNREKMTRKMAKRKMKKG